MPNFESTNKDGQAMALGAIRQEGTLRCRIDGNGIMLPRSFSGNIKKTD